MSAARTRSKPKLCTPASTPSERLSSLPSQPRLRAIELPNQRAIEIIKARPRDKKSGSHSVELPPLPDLADKRILALDLGRRTGWAVLTPETEDSGVHELYDDVRGTRPYRDGARFVALNEFLTKLETEHGPFDVVPFESVSDCKGRQVQLYNGYRATLMAWAEIRGKIVVPLPVGTIKKLVTGKGNADKEQMINALRELGYPVFDDNESDAIGILLTMLVLPEIIANAEARKRTVDKKLRLVHSAPTFSVGSTETERQRMKKPKSTKRPTKSAPKARRTKKVA